MSITSIVPVPRVVPCGGIMVKVAELRLRDLAFLQAALDDLEPDPLVAAQEAMPGKSPAECDLLIGQAYDRAESGPPVYGDARGRAYYSTPEGGSLFLWVALRRRNRISPVDAAKLYEACSGVEYGRIWRLAHGVTPLAAISRMMLPPSPGGQGEPPTWPEMICEVAEAYHMKPSDIYNLSISEWMFLRNRGKSAGVERPIMPGEDLAKIVTEQRRRFYGEEVIDQEGASPQV